MLVQITKSWLSKQDPHWKNYIKRITEARKKNNFTWNKLVA